MNQQICWGVLSTAKIGVEKVIPALQQSKLGKMMAISSRSKERAQEAADKLGIERTFGSYEALLADDEIDAVYNPLPNHLHVPWTIKALEAGKHVLCEKPIGLSVEETQKLADVAKNHPDLKVMEAFMYRFHPQWKKVKQLVEEAKIGDLKTIRSVFAYFNDDPDDIRNKAGMGGGGLMDIGCYNISLSRYLFDNEPECVIANVKYDPAFNVDSLTSAIMKFEGGTATFTCSTQMAADQGVTIYGEGGRIEIDIPFNAPPDQPAAIWLYADAKEEKITFSPANQYTLQGDAFARTILDDTPVPTPLDDAIHNMAVIEAIFESARQSDWVLL